MFGDSWIGPVRENRHAAGSAMVNNSIAIQDLREAGPQPLPRTGDSGANPSTVEADGAPLPLTFYWNASDPAHPAAWAIPTQAGEWFWPAGGGITTSEPRPRLLLFMSRLARRDKSDSVWNFAFRGTSLLIITNPADAPPLWRPAQFTISTLDADHPRDLMWGAAVLQDPDDPTQILFYGIDSRNALDRTLVLARAPLSTIERSETWSYFAGSGSGAGQSSPASGSAESPASRWTPLLSEATPIATNLAPELSLHYVPALHRYLMIHSEPPLGRGILARTAPRPEGPWSPPAVLYTDPDPDPRTLTYAAKAHPELSYPGSLLITYCVNSTDFWYMASHAEMYVPRAVRVPIAALISAR